MLIFSCLTHRTETPVTGSPPQISQTVVHVSEPVQISQAKQAQIVETRSTVAAAPIKDVTPPKSSAGKPSYVTKGVNSDEVRVMQKVLVNEVSLPSCLVPSNLTKCPSQVQLGSEECVELLNLTEWDVHRSIKCVRLREILKQHRVNIESVDWLCTLKKFNWNVRQTSNYLIATQGSSEGSTEV